MLKKTKYNETELAEFESIIDLKLSKANKELDYYLTQLKEQEDAEIKLKGIDDATSAQQKERVLILAGRQRKLIMHLDNAKLRIIKKVYGVCRETGELISKERLKAVPHATLSISAKQSNV